MDAAAVAWLRTEDGRAATAEALALLSSGLPPHTLVERLRRRWPDRSRDALDLVEGRRAAAAKHTLAGRLIVDRTAAEQASAEDVARWTARRFVGARRVADLGCGAGLDALALAEVAPVLAVDRDPARVAMARANADEANLAMRLEVVEGDALAPLPPEIDAVWLDPSRRDERGRVFDPERWSPPLADAVRIVTSVARGGIKVAPGIDLALVPEASEVEFISFGGRLVEAVLWFGAARQAAHDATRTATVLPEGRSLHGNPDTGTTPVRPPGRYLYDLDPAVGRASLVDVAAPTLDAWRLDERTAYLSGDRAVSSPFARRFLVRDVLPFSERQLRQRLSALGAARVEVMRRASPVETNALEERLNAVLRGGAGPVLTVALTRLAGVHAALIAERERD